MAIPGNIITGYLAKQPLAAIENGLVLWRCGPLKLLRTPLGRGSHRLRDGRLIPAAAILVAMGAFMAVVKQMWYIAARTRV